MTTRETYLSAVDSFAALVEQLPDEVWPEPALGVWNVRDLVGHTAAAALTHVCTVLDLPADTEGISTAEGYYALARSIDPAVYQAASDAATKRAHSDGVALGDHPAQAVHALVDRVTAKLATAGDDVLVQIHELVGGMRLAVWLPTRTFELAVHTLDLAAATGVPAALPGPVLTDAAALAARIAAATGDGPTVLRALTGRGTLGAGFSVV